MPRSPRSRSPRRNSRERNHGSRQHYSRREKDSFHNESPSRTSSKRTMQSRSYNEREEDDYDRDRRRRYADERNSYDRERREGREYNDDRFRRHRSPRSQRDSDRGGERRRSERERDSERERRRSRSRSPERRASRGDSSRPRSQSKSPTAEDKSKPNFKPSGLLAAATNTVQLSDGTKTVLKYNEPPEARKPQTGWRLYVFKGSEQTDVLHIHRQSAYLVGRDKAVVDIFVEHPSCSKQHAAIQFRQVQEKDEFGSTKTAVKPFIIDLESTNGTHVNDEAIPTSRYYELRASDVIKFGQSTREYVLLHDEV